MAEENKTAVLAEEDYIAGMKYKDIAAKYKVSLNTVKSWKKGMHGIEKGAHKIIKRVHTKIRMQARVLIMEKRKH